MARQNVNLIINHHHTRAIPPPPRTRTRIRLRDHTQHHLCFLRGRTGTKELRLVLLACTNRFCLNLPKYRECYRELSTHENKNTCDRRDTEKRSPTFLHSISIFFPSLPILLRSFLRHSNFFLFTGSSRYRTRQENNIRARIAGTGTSERERER